MIRYLKKITETFNIENPPYGYEFLMQLNEKLYPKYLKKWYKLITFEDLNLKKPKSLDEKIQWLKLNDATPLKTQLTDKILVRDYIKQNIGEEHLKPLLWTGRNFDEIPFSNLPNSFIIKCNHGCKWHIIVKNKDEFLCNNKIFYYSKDKITQWMNTNFFGISQFETQYKNIIPQILIEPLLRENINEKNEEFGVWCANGKPFIIDDNTEIRKEAVRLSQILAKGFKFVRVDWMVVNQKLYFMEMTFTPYSGFITQSISNNQEFFQKISDSLKI